MPDFPSVRVRKQVAKTFKEQGYTIVRAMYLDEIPLIASGEKPPRKKSFNL